MVLAPAVANLGGLRKVLEPEGFEPPIGQFRDGSNTRKTVSSTMTGRRLQ